MQVLQYQTVEQETSCEYIEKKSRFIAYVKPVSTEEEATSFISSIKSKHWDARHNVYAYCVGLGAEQTQRFSDDGEPQGTAGMPVLDVLRKQQLSNVVVVVTRYFGGVLLGASGLVRAYSKSAAMGVEASGVLHLQLCQVVKVTVDYGTLGRMQRELPARGYVIRNIEFDQNVSLFVQVPKEKTGSASADDPAITQFTALVTELTNGTGVTEPMETLYCK